MKEPLNRPKPLKLFGAPGRIRTRDPLITNQVLYQLSYKGIFGLSDNRFCPTVKENLPKRDAVTTPKQRRPKRNPARNTLSLKTFFMYHRRQPQRAA